MKTIMPNIGMVVIEIIILTLCGCNSDTSSPYGNNASPGTSAPNTLVMANLAFSPNTMTIKRGTTITWKNNDSYVHTSTSNTMVWDSGDIAPGTSKTTTFNTAGTFPFYCKYHQGMGMTGTITVQ
ncbi:MAG TPA: plastocyanin/azurin family copper-binding protein [Bacteroidota bacterium]|nr:plastocyanin/azurin family copper-binding protein [Bacteroidota bacterium]